LFKAGVFNRLVDVLSRITTLLVTLKIKIIEFDYLKYLYGYDEDFGEPWEKCYSQNLYNYDFHIYDGFLMRGN
jgi:hypothetical protein